MRGFLGHLRRMPVSARLGMAIIAANVLLAALVPLASPYGENLIVGPEFQPWSSQHWLGTDNLGRDLFTRMGFGARNSITIAVISTLVAFLIGSSIGIVGAVKGGWVDRLLTWFVDIMLSVPTLIFALLGLTIFGTDIVTLICILGIIYAAPVCRLTRAITIDIVVLDFIDVARLRGESVWWIARHEVLPLAMPLLVAEFGVRFCFVFLMISALSFLGLGIQPPAADWGSMVRDNATLITYGDWTPLLPAMAIAILAIGVNYLADWFVSTANGTQHDSRP